MAAKTCAQCGGRKAHPIHLAALSMEGHHPFQDASKPGLQTMSEGRRNYRASEAHAQAMALSAGAKDCWPHAYGAPGECYGKITPSHTYSVGQAGSLAKADEYPAPPACTWHNDAMEQDADVRAWAEVTYFTHNGRQWPFKVTAAYLTAERERMARL